MTPAASPALPAQDGWRTFLWLWGSQGLSVVGSTVSTFAMNIYLTHTRFPLPEQKPQLAAALSLIMLAWTVTASISTPLAGTWADRYQRRKMMLVGDLLSALVTLILFLLILMPAPPIWSLVLMSGLLGITATFHGSAFDALFSSIVPADRLPRANGMMQTIWSIAGLAGPAIASLLIGVPALLRDHGSSPAWLGALRDGVPFTFAVDVATFLLAAFVLTRLHAPNAVDRPDQRDGAAPPRTLAGDMRFGWDFIRQHRVLKALLFTVSITNLCVTGMAVLRPLVAKFTLADDWQAHGGSLAGTLAILTVSGSIGGLLGGVAVSVWGGLRTHRTLGVLLPMLLGGLSLIALGFCHTVVPAAAALFLQGLTVPLYAAHLHSIWQSYVPAAVQGRVFSVRRLIAQITAPASTALAGLLAAQYAPAGVAGASGALFAVVAAAQLLNPVLRRGDQAVRPAAPTTEPTSDLPPA